MFTMYYVTIDTANWMPPDLKLIAKKVWWSDVKQTIKQNLAADCDYENIFVTTKA